MIWWFAATRLITWLQVRGAGNGIRTHDIHLGKVAHYRCATPALPQVSLSLPEVPEVYGKLFSNASPLKRNLRVRLQTGPVSLTF